MHRGRFIFAAVLALVAASAQAATTPVVSSDFTLQDQNRLPFDWQFNGAAGFELRPKGSVPQFDMALTHNANSEAATVWTTGEFTLPSFTMWADVNIDFTRNNGKIEGDSTDTCPADGFAMAFGAVQPNALGGGGGAIGLFGNGDALPRFIGFEVNTWRGQALEDTDVCSSNKYTTFAFENVNADTDYARNTGETGDKDKGGAKVGQVNAPPTLKIVNGGWYRYQWNVDTAAGTMSAFVTGLDASNKAVQNLKVAEVTFGASAPKLAFKGRFGLAAGTGGAVMGTHVAQVVVVSPAVAAGSIPTAGQ
jgi:hypothetical protein